MSHESALDVGQTSPTKYLNIWFRDRRGEWDCVGENISADMTDEEVQSYITEIYGPQYGHKQIKAKLDGVPVKGFNDD